MRIIISGLTASGKTYQAKKIAENFSLKYISGSDVLLEVANTNISGVHQWLDKDAKQLHTRRRQDYDLDKRVDKKLLHELTTNENIIIDTWTLPWLYDEGNVYKIYLKASLKERALISYHSRTSVPYQIEELEKKIEKKDRLSKNLYKEIYGIDITDLSPFQLIVQNGSRTPEETEEIITRNITHHFDGNL